jgi:hypothetical protein
MLSFVAYFRGSHARRHSVGRARARGQMRDPQVASWGCRISPIRAFACGPLDEVAANLRKGKIWRPIPAWQNLLYQCALLAKCHVPQGNLTTPGGPRRGPSHHPGRGPRSIGSF